MRALQHDVTVIDNLDIDASVRAVMTIILQAVSEYQQPAEEQGTQPC